MKKDEEREVPDPWESIEEVLVVVLKVLEVFLEVFWILLLLTMRWITIDDEMNYY